LERLIIVGIDIGITTGIAILNARGEILSVDSKREMKKDEIIKNIIKFGKPLIIASDVNPLPKSIESVVNEFGSKAFVPEKSLSVEEKAELTKNYNNILKNDHEKDALAAALKAWKKYRGFFEKINAALEEVVLKIFKRESENIENAIREVFKEKLIKVEEKPEEKYKKEIKSLEKKLKEKESEIKKLRLEYLTRIKNFTLKKEVIEKTNFLAKEVKKLRKEIEKLRQANDFLKKTYEIEEKGFYPVIEFEEIDHSKLKEIDEKIGLKNRIVFCQETKGIEIFNDFGIKAALVSKPPEKEILEKIEFPLIVYDKFKEFSGIKCVEREEVEKEIREAKKFGLIEWLKRYRERKL
jgi:predicted RNase H-like nuclease (RuvC/YqgF family)